MNSRDKKNRSSNSKIVVNQNMKDHSNDPFFVQKAEASKKVIQKYGLPKNLVAGKK
jgi:hypothetical protein